MNKEKLTEQSITPLNTNNQRYTNVPLLFTLKILLKLEGWERWAKTTNNFVTEQLSFQITAEPKLTLDKYGRLSKQRLSRLLLEQGKTTINQESRVEKKLQQLARDFLLNTNEVAVIRLLYYTRSNQALDESSRLIFDSGFTYKEFYHYASILLDLTVEDIKQVIDKNSMLIKKQVTRRKEGGGKLRDFWLVDNIFSMIDEEQAIENPVDWFMGEVQQYPPEALDTAEIFDQEQDVNLLSNYLAQVLRKKIQSVNILLTGKSQKDCRKLAETVIANASGQVIDIKSQKAEIDDTFSSQVEIKSEVRFDHNLQVQHLFGKDEESVVLLEDAFDYIYRLDSLGENIKPDRLAENVIPIIWTMSDTVLLEDKLIHQFDMVFDVRLSHQYARRQLIDQHLGEFNLDNRWLDKLSGNNNVTENIIKNLTKVATTLSLRDPVEIQSHMDRMIGNILGKRSGNRSENSIAHSEYYDISLLNADIDIQELAEGLNHSSEGRIILSGPPGTGKTAFAKYISQATGRSLIVKTGSSLLGRWIGDTEKNIARAFADATHQNAVLLIDEADSFLSSRESVEQRWEASMTNEFLIQMENFSGIMIACTNFKQQLDSAVQRRFDFKIELDYMTAEQIQKMLFEMASDSENESSMDSGVVSSHFFEQRASQLVNITPGDFNTVRRRLKVLGKAVTMDSLVSGLVVESKAKPGFSQQSRAIGFTTAI
ncbi:MAG: AAA family ATPase [Gammaproteobacteria bacterium]|nr:AAA family ATPase [Gammaproteobacteria bacterium]